MGELETDQSSDDCGIIRLSEYRKVGKSEHPTILPVPSRVSRRGLCVIRRYYHVDAESLYHLLLNEIILCVRRHLLGSIGLRPLPTAYCLLPTPYCLLPTAYCLLPTTYCLLLTRRSLSVGGSPDS